MNLEQFLAGAVVWLGIGLVAGLLIYRWLTGDLTRREAELETAIEWLDVQRAQLEEDEERLVADRAVAEDVMARAKRINDETRQTLKAATAPFEADEMADTVLVDPINVQTIVQAARKYL